jgi:hypothetical protein
VSTGAGVSSIIVVSTVVGSVFDLHELRAITPKNAKATNK